MMGFANDVVTPVFEPADLELVRAALEEYGTPRALELRDELHGVPGFFVFEARQQTDIESKRE